MYTHIHIIYIFTWPWIVDPPVPGWWIIVRECGSARRLPLVPPTSSSEPLKKQVQEPGQLWTTGEPLIGLTRRGG